MVTITINGVKKDREFQNMAQALAFVYQNGECHNAERLEMAYAVAPGSGGPRGKTAEETGQNPENAQGQAENPHEGGSGAGPDMAQGGGDNPDQAGKPLEELTRKELEALAEKLGIAVKTGAGNFFKKKDAELIAAIRAAEGPKGETAEQAGGAEVGTGTSEESNTGGTDTGATPDANGGGGADQAV